MIVTLSESNKPKIITFGYSKGKLYLTEQPIRYRPIRYFISTIRPLQ